MTWLEAMILFQLQTGFIFPSSDSDLLSMEKMFKDIVLKILKASTIRYGKKKPT